MNAASMSISSSSSKSESYESLRCCFVSSSSSSSHSSSYAPFWLSAMSSSSSVSHSSSPSFLGLGFWDIPIPPNCIVKPPLAILAGNLTLPLPFLPWENTEVNMLSNLAQKDCYTSPIIMVIMVSKSNSCINWSKSMSMGSSDP
jgi:hypothetical protein